MDVGVAHDAALHLHHAVLGVSRHESQIALQGEGESDTDGVTVDRRDHRLADVPRLEPQSGRVERRPIDAAEGVAARREVGAAAERRGRAGEHDGAHVVVGVAPSVHVSELGAHARAERRCAPRVGAG